MRGKKNKKNRHETWDESHGTHQNPSAVFAENAKTTSQYQASLSFPSPCSYEVILHPLHKQLITFVTVCQLAQPSWLKGESLDKAPVVSMLHTMNLKCSAASHITGAISLAAFIVLSITSIAPADEGASQHAAIDPLTRTWTIQPYKEGPYPLLDYGGHLRIRYASHKNVTDLGLCSDPDPVREFFRIRSRLWLKYAFSPTTRAYARLANESRIYLTCESCDTYFDEVIFENLYVEFTDLFGLPLGARLGRQDLFYGDGFLICDGGPLDGSRTGYVNGALLSGSIPLWSYDIFTAYNPEMDEYLPRINNRYTRLIEHDEFLVGLLLRRRNEDGGSPRYAFEPYYVFKEESASGRESQIHTIGTRIGFGLLGTRVSMEFAYQGGRPAQIYLPDESLAQRPDTLITQTISALGGNVRMDLGLSRPVPSTISGGFIFLSGDDPKTLGKFEGWNPMLGRWPNWSELYVYTLLMEDDVQPMKQGVAYWQNLKAPFIGIDVIPHNGFRLQARYLWLGADESVFYNHKIGGHTHRGHLYTARLSWVFPRLLDGHLLLERFTPGDFYPVEAEDATFFRLEVSRSF
jgi:hypothetical protein